MNNLSAGRRSEFPSSEEAKKLFYALKKRGIPAELEKWDGHKTIDIAITKAMVNIEVDGRQHNTDPSQALADLQRTLYSFKKGYITLRVPNSVINHNLDIAVEYICKFIVESRDQLNGW